MPELGLPELLVIFVVLILVFGAGKVGDIGGALGKSVREFRRAAIEPEEPGQSVSARTAPSTTSQATAARFCSNCGVQLNSDAKFCAQCGASNQATVVEAPSSGDPSRVSWPAKEKLLGRARGRAGVWRLWR